MLNDNQAMHEYVIKLELKEGITQTQEEDLEIHENQYNRLMSDLTELKELKEQKSNEVQQRKQDTSFQMDRVNDDNEKLRKEKEYLIQKQQ